MLFFLDTADIKEIRDLADTGLIDGITTNPTLAAQTGKTFIELIKEICAIIPGPVSAEVAALTAEDMIREGQHLAQIAPNVVVKVPLTPEGLKACHVLNSKGIEVNVTLCFTATQALLAAKAGATFISPFCGRLDDISQDGIELIADIKNIYNNYPHYTTKILAASIRHPHHVLQAARFGADVVTMPPKIFRQLFKHPLTDSGIEQFSQDWEKAGLTIL
jgi:transaldolase